MRKSIKRNLAYDDQKDLYYVTMHYGMRPDGSRDRCVRTFRCLDDAESTLTEFLRLRALKRTRHGGEVILADWLEVWLRDFICPNREKTTVHGYENIIRLHLVPALGEVKLPELQPAQLQRYYAELLEKGLSHNTVRKHHVLLHTALEAAVRQGLLRENVTRYVTPPAKVLPSHRYYDPAQLRELFCRCAGTEIEPAVKLAGYLGLRRSEICGLKWRCVDLDAKIVTVREVRTSVGGTFIEKKPKSYSSVRRLCYDGVSDLEELLTRLHDEWERGQRERGAGFNPEGYVAVRSRESRGTRTASDGASRSSLRRMPCRPSRSTACATALRALPTAAACRCSPSPRRSATARRASRARSTRTFSTRRCRMW